MIKIITLISSCCQNSGHHEEAAWATGPINLLRALRDCPEYWDVMRRGYGNHGHIDTWIEVDGVQLETPDIGREHYTLADARDILREVASGALERRYAAADRALEAKYPEVDILLDDL